MHNETQKPQTTRLNDLGKEEPPWRSAGLRGSVATATRQHGASGGQAAGRTQLMSESSNRPTCVID